MDGLVQERCNSSVSAVELCLSLLTHRYAVKPHLNVIKLGETGAGQAKISWQNQ